MLLVGGGTAAGLTILSGQQIQWHWWISLLAATGNAIGLFLGLLLMSYGMVEIPKRLWYLSNLHAIHQSMYHRVGVNHANALEAKRCAPARRKAVAVHGGGGAVWDGPGGALACRGTGNGGQG